VGQVSVSVLVPVLNEAEHLEEALAAMLSQSGCGEIEVLVIDGLSTDATAELAGGIAAADPRVRLLTNPERRTPNALNIGLRAARGEFVARMDAHCMYPPRYLADGIERLRAGGVAWVSGPQIPLGRGTWSRRVALALGSPFGVGGAGFRSMSNEEREVDSGFTGVWRRELLLGHGGWDEDWPVNQDGELAARIRGDGDRIVCLPEMAASYVPRNSLSSLRRQYWRYGQYRAKTSGRHPESMRRSHVLPPALVALALVGLGRGRVSRGARLGLIAYALILVAATARDNRDEALGDKVGVVAALITMHASWGAGFLAGCARFGIPVAAIRRIVGR
jgi:glycosyltransferase involved in cell wall biosynthesis